jgi:hypothetical protein
MNTEDLTFVKQEAQEVANEIIGCEIVGLCCSIYFFSRTEANNPLIGVNNVSLKSC